WFSVRSPVSASQRHFPLAPGCLPGLRGGADGGVHGLAAAEPLTSSFWPPSPLDGSPPKGLSDDGGFEEFVEFLASRSASSTVIACNRHRSSRRAPELSPSKKARFIAERLTGGLFDMPAKESDARLPRQHFSPETAQSSQYTAPPRIRDCERFPFACHFSQKMCTPAPTYTCKGYSLARSNNIVLRADSVGSAVQSLLTKAAATETIANQYRVGLYPFISKMGTLYAISNNLTGAQTAAGTLGSLLDTGQSTSIYGSGGTHFENAIPAMNTAITTIGDGSGALKTAALRVSGDGRRRQQSILHHVIEQLDRLPAAKYGPHPLHDPQESRNYGRGSLHSLSADQPREFGLRGQ